MIFLVLYLKINNLVYADEINDENSKNDGY